MKGTRLCGKVRGFSAVTLQTSLSLDECHNRLVRAVDAEKLSFSLSGYAGTKPILGKIRGDTFRLQKRISYRNDCRPFFYGRFVPTEGGSLIEGEFRMHPCAKWFMVFWFSFLALLLVVALGNLATGQAALRETTGFIAGVLGMMVFGVLLVKFSWWLCRRHAGIIVAFLKETFGLGAEDERRER